MGAASLNHRPTSLLESHGKRLLKTALLGSKPTSKVDLKKNPNNEAHIYLNQTVELFIPRHCWKQQGNQQKLVEHESLMFYQQRQRAKQRERERNSQKRALLKPLWSSGDRAHIQGCALGGSVSEGSRCWWNWLH